MKKECPEWATGVLSTKKMTPEEEVIYKLKYPTFEDWWTDMVANCPTDPDEAVASWNKMIEDNLKDKYDLELQNLQKNIPE